MGEILKDGNNEDQDEQGAKSSDGQVQGQTSRPVPLIEGITTDQKINQGDERGPQVPIHDSDNNGVHHVEG
jgi:hypothetical protein